MNFTGLVSIINKKIVGFFHGGIIAGDGTVTAVVNLWSKGGALILIVTEDEEKL
jgi:hypothetical protein